MARNGSFRSRDVILDGPDRLPRLVEDMVIFRVRQGSSREHPNEVGMVMRRLTPERRLAIDSTRMRDWIERATRVVPSILYRSVG